MSNRRTRFLEAVSKPLLLIVLAALALAIPAWAQAPQVNAPEVSLAEVGIDEKLGQTVPLDLVLRDENGRDVTLRSLITKPTVLTLNYFQCAGICTPQLMAVVDVADRTGAEPGTDFQILTVSFDDRDTPEVAAEKRTNYLRELTRPFPPEAWRFLTGDAVTTRALADAVGFKFMRAGEDFVHAAALILLSPGGEVTRYMYGVTYLPADLEMAVQEAARGEVRPTINKFLAICFSYDPAGRRYVLNVTSVAAILTLMAASVFVIVLVRGGRRRSATTKEPR